MNIGIDISTVLNFGINVGSGRYIINLLNGLFRLALETQEGRSGNESETTILNTGSGFKNNIKFTLTGRHSHNNNTGIIRDLIESYPGLKIDTVFFMHPQDKINSWDERGFPPIELKGFKADMLHCPDYIIPPSINKNIILTIHDLSFYRFPEFNFDWFIKKYQSMVLKNARRAKIIIADSESTRDDIIHFMEIDPRKIKVVYLAADDKFRVLASEELDRSALEKFNIKERFILSVGTIEPRKNFSTLIKAFNILKAGGSGPEGCQLVIAGKTGWKSEETFEEYNKSLFKKDIVFAGEVTDEELVQLYNQASLFVYPSIFEGFGLPLLEAMSCGLPVIASGASSVPEIYPNEEFLLNPFDEENMAQKINLVLSDSKISSGLVKFSLENAKNFSWKKSAMQTMQAYQALHGISNYK